MLPTPLLLLLGTLLPFVAAHNLRIYSDTKCTHDLNWAGLGQSATCMSWASWFSAGAFLLDAAADDDSTIVVFTEGSSCKSDGGAQYLVANVTAGCTVLPGWVSSVQVQNFTLDGDKKVPKVGKRGVGAVEVRWSA